MNRLIIFANPRYRLSRILLASALAGADKLGGLDVIGICDVATQYPPYPWLFRSRLQAIDLLKRVFNPALRAGYDRDSIPDFHRTAGRFGVPVIVPPRRQVNDPAFVRRLSGDLKPTLALSLGCPQVFKPELLRAVGYAVNYHNGLLPLYRGAEATRWSVYHQAPVSGFTFHVMNERIDAGPLLVQGALPVLPEEDPAELEIRKSLMAAGYLEQVLQMMIRREPGTPLQGPSSFYGLKDIRQITRIESPSEFTAPELRRRLYAFGTLYLKLNERTYPVTQLTECAGRGQARKDLRFQTRDGVILRPTRLLYLPLSLYWLWQKFLRAPMRST